MILHNIKNAIYIFVCVIPRNSKMLCDDALGQRSVTHSRKNLKRIDLICGLLHHSLPNQIIIVVTSTPQYPTPSLIESWP